MKGSKLDLLLHGENPLALERLMELLHPAHASILPLNSSGREALREHQFGFILVADEGSHDGSRQRLLHLVSEIRGKARILVVGRSISTFELHRLMLAGANGFILYRDVKRHLKWAVAAIRNGRSWMPLEAAEKPAGIEVEAELPPVPSFGQRLTTQEALILNLLTKNGSNKEIGNQLRISEATVKFHVSNLFKKLGVRDRRSAATLGHALAVSNTGPTTDPGGGFPTGPAQLELVNRDTSDTPQHLIKSAKVGGK